MMRGGFVVLLLALLVGAIHAFEASVETKPTFDSHLKLRTADEQESDAFDYFVFSQQWPGTYCKQSGSCCDNVEEPVKFTVHGLWPENEDGSYPACCGGLAFDQGKIDELVDLLQEYWPTMSCSAPEQCNGKKSGTFWQHEWEKHGTCSSPYIPDEATYFTVGLNLRMKYDISKILNNAGFVPDGKTTYTTSKVVAAVKAAVGGTPVFTCKSKQINEIWVCFTKDLKIRDCNPSANTCSSSLLIPPFEG